jgi:AAA15 family ATPase/GTPase
MPISQQKLHKLEVQTLKNLRNLDISFDGSPITAILGPNGNGKSTILHALACAFEPNEEGENYKFSSFLRPNTDALWDGSAMRITHTYRDGRVLHENITREYSKTSDRWSPRYANRPKRDVFYIGIDKCVPMIESEKKQAKINYSTEELTEEFVDRILEKASVILNKRYTKINRHIASGKEFIGVEADGLRYSALSMSAGEQKIFFILEKVFRAKKYSLILIDELDLLLHDDAMKKLITIIYERAVDKSIQIVFTTHRESILELSDKVNIRHIICKDDKSLCFNETKPDAIKRLTGQQPKPIEVFVEDDLASKIVSKIAGQLRIKKYVSIQRFGAAINCFTIVGGLILSGEDCQNSLFLIDGDIYTTTEEKTEKVSRVITGDDEKAVNSRVLALQVINQFILPEGLAPEKHIHSIISALQHTKNEEFNEIIDAAREIVVVDNNHKYIDDIIERLGWDKSEGLTKVIDLASTSERWEHYVEPVKTWLESKAVNVREDMG